MKRIILLTLILPLASCGTINSAMNKYVAERKVSLVPFKSDFKYLLKTDAAAIFSAKNTQFWEDINDVFGDWVEMKCAKSDLNEQACKKAYSQDPAQITTAIAVAFEDFNRDGKKDIILQLGGETGRSGLGVCGTSEYRFYENIGQDYRPIGHLRILNAQSIWVVDDAHKDKGEFQSIMLRSDVDCENKPLNSQTTYKFDYGKKRYFDLKLAQ